MNYRKNINKGLQIGTQNNQGGEINNAGRDVIINKNTNGTSLQEFQSLLSQINSQLQTANLSASDKEDIEAIISQVLKQTQKDEPKKNLIVGPLTTAFELITQAAGAATSIATISQLVQKAVTFAQNLF